MASSPGSSSSPRRMGMLLRIVLVLIASAVALLIVYRASGTGRYRSKSSIRLLRKNPNAFSESRSLSYTKDWLQFQSQHGLEYDDRLSFAEMALQTSSYSAMLKDAVNYDEATLVEAEELLYPWIHDLASIRSKHVTRNHRSTNGILRQAAHLAHGQRDVKQIAKKGIVIAAGNRQFKYTTQLVATIRRGLNCSLPIEIYYYGDEDLARQKRLFLEEKFSDVRTVDLSEQRLLNESFVRLSEGTWALKPYAVLFTQFTEVMLLDADSVLLADPHDFFLELGYRATGTLFFHDRLVRNWHSDTLHLFLREQLGERKPSGSLANSVFWREGLSHRQESGLVLLDKSKAAVFASLLFIVWQNAGNVRDRITYNVFYGDKETFWLPFELAGLPYHFSRYWAGAIGPERSAHSDGFCSDHILHFFEAPYAAHAPRSLQHINDDVSKRGRPAWFNGALRSNKLWDPDEGVMNIQKSIWTMDGSWVWRSLPDQGGATCCMIDYTRWSMADLNLGTLLHDIFRAGGDALRLINEFDDEE